MTEAERIHYDYQKLSHKLEIARTYARRVIAATEGSSRTPVEPLATMGPGGGPLLCDVCGKAMLIEGGPHNGWTFDQSWKADPTPGRVSWVLHGVVLQIEPNGSLRVYHGYPGASGCVLQQKRESVDEQELSRKLDLLAEELKLSDSELNRIYQVLRNPGLGVNHE